MAVPTVCDRDLKAAERELEVAMQDYKQSSGRKFPTWSEVLEVLVALGYEKAAGGGVQSGRSATAREATP